MRLNFPARFPIFQYLTALKGIHIQLLSFKFALRNKVGLKELQKHELL